MEDDKSKTYDTAIVDGKTVAVSNSPAADHQKTKGNAVVYWSGFLLRAAGLLGLAYVVALLIPSGPFFWIIALAYWNVTLPSMLAIAVGHYLASNWKPAKVLPR